MGKLTEGQEQLDRSIAFVKDNGNDYMDLYGRCLVDIAIDLIIGYLFCSQASSKVDMEVAVAEDNSQSNGKTISMKKRKAMLARRFITKNAMKITALAEIVCNGDKSTFTDYQTLIGPVPTE